MSQPTLAEAREAFVSQVKSKLEAAIVESGMSRENLAHALEVTPEYLEGLFNGTEELSLRMIALICHELGYECSITLPPREEQSVPDAG